jgi:hypothetical protein
LASLILLGGLLENTLGTHYDIPKEVSKRRKAYLRDLLRDPLRGCKEIPLNMPYDILSKSLPQRFATRPLEFARTPPLGLGICASATHRTWTSRRGLIRYSLSNILKDSLKEFRRHVFQRFPRLLNDCLRAFTQEGSRKPKITGIASKTNGFDSKTIKQDKNSNLNKGFESEIIGFNRHSK